MPRPEPERTCIGCRTVASKGSLIRIVRSPTGEVRVDLSGRAAGRGAYVHPATACVTAATRGGSVSRSLRVRLAPERAARLMEELLERTGATS